MVRVPLANVLAPKLKLFRITCVMPWACPSRYDGDLDAIDQVPVYMPNWVDFDPERHPLAVSEIDVGQVHHGYWGL